MREILTILALSFLGAKAFAQINSGSPAIPFGSKTAYSYGIMPTNLPSSGTYKSSQDAADAYTAWKNDFVATCSSSQSRVLYDDANTTAKTGSTVSEGIAYGMLLAAYAGDKTLLDALWAYYKAHVNNNGLMNWKYSDCNNSSGQNGAVDAEEDAAMALMVAEIQWPSATSPYDYKTEATSLVGKIRQYEIHPTTYQVINGDAWTFNSTCRNPSYIATPYYREFGNLETSYSSFWNSTVSTSQSFLLTNRNSTTGLVSNWADNNASPNTCNGPQDFGWDAIRNPWRMATDVVWNGSTTATTGYDICSKMSAWAKNYADNLKGPVALNASDPSTGSYKCGTFSMIGLAFMGAGSTYQNALNTAYTNTVNLGNSETYFSRTLRCITLFMMTGNFWKPVSSTTTLPTATITAASATSFCSGGSVILNASTGTGYSYQWKKDNSNISGATAASYTASASGSYTVVVTANSQSATSAATVVTVNALPTANAGKDVAICNGKSTSLTATGGGTYAWSNNVATATNVVSPTKTTEYIVTVTNTNSCTSKDTVVVTVNAIPAAPSVTTPVSYTVGATAAALTASGTNLAWYSVATGGSALSGAPVPSTSTTGTTSYYVSQTVNTCESPRASIDVVITPAPMPKVQLKAGWNLIGCPIDGSTNVDKALSSIWPNVTTIKNQEAFYDKTITQSLNSLQQLNWGCGYFVKVSADCELDWSVK